MGFNFQDYSPTTPFPMSTLYTPCPGRPCSMSGSSKTAVCSYLSISWFSGFDAGRHFSQVPVLLGPVQFLSGCYQATLHIIASVWDFPLPTFVSVNPPTARGQCGCSLDFRGYSGWRRTVYLRSLEETSTLNYSV